MGIIHPKVGEIDDHKIMTFIQTAKRNGWASGREPDTRVEDVDKFFYMDEDFKYSDNFRGGKRFMGTELVSFKGEIIWGMNYYGKMIEIPEEARKSNETVNSFSRRSTRFLQSALMNCPELLAFRGPIETHFALDRPDYGRFEYWNAVTGVTKDAAIWDFSGVEDVRFITNQSKMKWDLPKTQYHVFRTVYHGGIIIP